MNDAEIQWHPGFVAAMELELLEYEDKLHFQSEYNLSTKPLQIDLLVIKKDEPVEITNEVGRFFKKYNIMEYKSPDDSLNIDTLYKVQAYAALYKSSGNAVDERRADEITVSLVREGKPLELFKTLNDMNIQITAFCSGVYYISSGMLFPTQVIVTKELSGERHTWIKSLSRKMNMSDMKMLLYKTASFKGERERELADSVLEIALRVNENLVNELRGDVDMSSALMELVEPLIQEREREAKIIGRQEGRQEGRREGRREGICGTIDVLRNLGHSDVEIKTAIMGKYSLSEKETEELLQ